MIGRTTYINEPYAPWSQRVSLFALVLIVVAALLHRVSVMSTPVALNLMGAGFMLAALGLCLGIYAASSIWFRGRAGAWSCAWGILIACGLWLWPAAMAPTYLSLPAVYDISTNTAQPPAFVVAGKQRAPGANATAYNPAFAALQARAYPDLHTLRIPRSAEEVYELTLDLVRGRRGLGWKVVADDAPQTRLSKPGLIEATDRTMILGFTDDIVIRIAGDDSEARVDIRSQSRYGGHDFGTNAARVRRFVRDLSTRLDAAGPVGVSSRGGVRINRADARNAAIAVKRPLDRKSEKAGRER